MDHLTRNGLVLAFEDAGKGAPPILLVHDPGVDPVTMAPQLAEFRDKYRVIVPDLGGRGQCHESRSAPELGDVADDLAWLCYELGVYRPVAIGHRVGGSIALELAGRFPDLLKALVTLDAPIDSAGLSRAGRSGNEMGVGGLELARRVIPWLRIETETPTDRLNALSGQFPGANVQSILVNHLQPDEAMRRAKALIDAFLSGCDWDTRGAPNVRDS